HRGHSAILPARCAGRLRRPLRSGRGGGRARRRFGHDRRADGLSMNAPFPPAEARHALIERHADLIEAAIKAVSARAAWSPFKDSPSTKIHGPDKPVAGKAAFEAQLNRPFDLDLPGVIDRVGAEVSPFTGEALGITYPRCDPEALIVAAQTAWPDWRAADPELRLALCAEMATRLYDVNFEMAQAV